MCAYRDAQATAKHLSGDARSRLRAAVASVLECESIAVQVDSIKQTHPGLDITLTVSLARVAEKQRLSGLLVSAAILDFD